MTFNKCSINGRVFGDIIDMSTGDVIEPDEVSSKQQCSIFSTFRSMFYSVVLDFIIFGTCFSFLQPKLHFGVSGFSLIILNFSIEHIIK